MNCEEVLEQLSEYVDKEARDELCRQIEAHLSTCRDCKVEVDTVQKTIILYQADRAMQTPFTVSSRLDAALAREYRR